MHPDEAVDIALQDLHISLGLRTVAPADEHRPWLARAVMRVLRRWMDGWTWYARQGLAPAASEPVFPLRPRARRLALPRHRAAQPCPPPRFALLYGRPGAAGCP